jgi:single-strand DNA-binding protein
MQLVIYEGYLAADPEMRYTPAGKAVTNFRIGSNRKWKNAEGEDMKETTWLKIAAWDKLAEIVAKYCHKGSHVIVTGVLRVGKGGSPEPYQLSSGEWGASYEITAREVNMLDKKPVDGEQTASHETAPANDDDIPF